MAAIATEVATEVVALEPLELEQLYTDLGVIEWTNLLGHRPGWRKSCRDWRGQRPSLGKALQRNNLALVLLGSLQLLPRLF